MNFHCLEHAPFEGPVRIGDWIRERGHTLIPVPLYLSAPLPALSQVDALVIMGGSMNIYQHRDHPWLPKEKQFLREALAQGKKVVGICLGSQLLADVLGGPVVQNREREIGWFPVDFTNEARTRFPFLPTSQHVLHWHGDTFSLPPGPDIVRLASSAGCVQQGFLYKDQAIGLQFHMESTVLGDDPMIEACRHELTPDRYVQDEATLRRLSRLHAPEAGALLFQLLDALFQAKSLSE